MNVIVFQCIRRVGQWRLPIASGESVQHGAVVGPPYHMPDGCSGTGHGRRGRDEPQYCGHGRSGCIYALRCHSPEGLKNLNTGLWASRMHLSAHRRGVAGCHCSLPGFGGKAFSSLSTLSAFSPVRLNESTLATLSTARCWTVCEPMTIVRKSI